VRRKKLSHRIEIQENSPSSLTDGAVIDSPSSGDGWSDNDGTKRIKKRAHSPSSVDSTPVKRATSRSSKASVVEVDGRSDSTGIGRIKKHTASRKCRKIKDATRNSRDMRDKISSIVTPSPASRYAIKNLKLVELPSPSVSSTSLDAVIDKEDGLPDGVVNIDSFSFTCRNDPRIKCSCHHDRDHCSPTSLTESYLSSYSQDHDAYLESAEDNYLATDSVSACFSIATTSTTSSPQSLSPQSQRPVMKRRSKRLWKKTADKDVPFSHATINVECSEYCIIPKPNEEVNYLSRHQELNAGMRAVLIDWLIEVAQEFELLDITLHTAVELVDRSLARALFVGYGGECAPSSDGNRLVVNRETLQLLGCACMLIAGKIHEFSAPTVSDYTYISASSYSTEQVVDMELNICSALHFRFQVITPLNFVDRLLRASYVSSSFSKNVRRCAGMRNDIVKCMVDYFLEIAMLYYKYVTLKPSLIAASALYLTRATLGIRDNESTNVGFWCKTLEYYSGYDSNELENPVRHLHQAHSEAEDGKQKTVFTKYSGEKFLQVALKTVLTADDLGFP